MAVAASNLHSSRPGYDATRVRGMSVPATRTDYIPHIGTGGLTVGTVMEETPPVDEPTDDAIFCQYCSIRVATIIVDVAVNELGAWHNVYLCSHDYIKLHNLGYVLK